jgi:hypothetical protein
MTATEDPLTKQDAIRDFAYFKKYPIKLNNQE